MSSQADAALETFAQDVRMASGIVWNSSTSITLTVPDSYAGTANKVTYAWENNSALSTYRCFYQMPGTAADTNTRKVLLRNVNSFSYARFDRLDATTTSDAQTKRIQISMVTRRSGVTTVATTSALVSANFILRNKVI